MLSITNNGSILDPQKVADEILESLNQIEAVRKEMIPKIQEWKEGMLSKNSVEIFKEFEQVLVPLARAEQNLMMQIALSMSKLTPTF